MSISATALRPFALGLRVGCENTGMSNTRPKLSRPLTDLTRDELSRALCATEAAAGPNSYSANALRQALAQKEATQREKEGRTK